MSKKMKGVAFDLSPYGVYEDAKTRLKHQTLMQDYQELQKETDAITNKLEIMKQRKLMLSAEVRFLRRRRHKRLQEINSQNLPMERHKKTPNERIYLRNQATLKNTVQSCDANKKDRISNRKGSARQKSAPVLDSVQKDNMHGGKEPSLTPVSVFYPNRKEQRFVGKKAISSGLNPILDLNNKDRTNTESEAIVSHRAPIFDLNQIAREELEFIDNSQPLRIEEPKKSVSRSGTDDLVNDLKLPLCRNVGNGNRAGKRKISWQDPVALKV